MEVDGIRFASKREAERWCQLRLREKAGEISHLERQPVFKLAIGDRPVLIRSKGYPNGRQARYVADFAYFDGDELVKIEEVSGISYGRAEVRSINQLIAQADALLEGADEDFHRPFVAAIRAFFSALDRAGTP